jgi:hypothetical protein
MKWYDENTKTRLTFYFVGLGTGALLLLVWPQTGQRVITKTEHKVQVVERIIEKVVFRDRVVDRWRDHVVTTTKPDGTKIVVVDKSGSTEKEKESEKETEVSTDRRESETKVVDTSDRMRSRYFLGTTFSFLDSSVSPTFGARLGGLPVWAIGGLGSVGTLPPYKIDFRPSVGLQLEW